jgi:hypothetical protein
MHGIHKRNLTMNRTNALRNLSLSLLLAAGAFAAPAHAQVSFNVVIAPPAPQYEVVPVMQPGYVWAPGYWGWSGDHHVWVRGRPIVQREGYRWEPDRWDQRNQEYYRTAGHWQRDNDYKPAKVMKREKHHDRDGDDQRDDNRGHGKGNRHES